ncbi:MAG: hypothetical protein AAB176_12910 [Pseudomonadota bacterium]
MAEPSVQLGVRTGPHADLHGGGTMQQSPHDADPQAAARFGQALAQTPAAQDASATARGWGGPFDLLGAVPKVPLVSELASEASAQASLMAVLQDATSQLLVGEGQGGRREARITLDESLMPGVCVALYEDAGAWVADVCCSDATSYQTLARAVSDLARQMALALARDALWRVTLEATPDSDAVTVEAFASCP